MIEEFKYFRGFVHWNLGKRYITLTAVIRNNQKSEISFGFTENFTGNFRQRLVDHLGVPLNRIISQEVRRLMCELE